MQTSKHCCGNTICDSRCFLKCFPVCPPVETLLRKQNLLPEKQNCFLANSETFDVSLCFSLMFPSVCPLCMGNMAKHRQEAMFPQQCFLVCPGLYRSLDWNTPTNVVLRNNDWKTFKRQFFSMSRIYNEKCSKPKIFLAFLSESLCFCFIL